MRHRMQSLHHSINADRVITAVKRRMTTLANPGFCIACGRASNDCDPDTRNARCDYCGKPKVFGAEELLAEITS